MASSSTESPLPPPSSPLLLPLLIALFIIVITALILVALHILITKLCATTAVSPSAPCTSGQSGVDKAVLASIPVYIYAKEREEHECAVCLGVLEHGEPVRALPGCCHVFHVDCIDRWLTSHSEYCPLCRTVVVAEAVALPIGAWEGSVAEASTGSQDRYSEGGGSQLLVRSGSLLSTSHAASSLLSLKEKLQLKRSLSMRCFIVSIQHEVEPYDANV